MAWNLRPTLLRGACAGAVTAALLLAAGASAHASPGDAPVRGEADVPLRVGGTLGQLNPQPEPPGAAARPGGPADGQCATCEPPGSEGGPHQGTGWKPYEIEIKKIWVCDTEDSSVDEVYININGVRVWGAEGLTYGSSPGHCRVYGLYHREAYAQFTGWANVDVYDWDGIDPDDHLLTGTAYTTTNPPGWSGTWGGTNSQFSYFLDYEVRKRY
jgi:hypothetical protein